MKILKIIGFSLIGLVAIILIAVMVLAPTSHLERDVVIERSAASIFEEVNVLKSTQNWSPWHKIDPNTQYTFEGPDEGVGAKMSWVSEDPNVGVGSQWILESEKNKFVKSQMQFEGIDGVFLAELILEPVEGGTHVTWTYDGDVSNTSFGNASMGKLFWLMAESTLGPSYEEGLNSLKEVVEAKPNITIEIGMTELTPMSYIGITSKMNPKDMDAISNEMGKSYGEIGKVLAQSKVQMAGARFSLYPSYSEEMMEMVCAIPVAPDAKISNKKYVVMQTQGGKAIKGIHMGDYSNLEETHKQINEYIAYKKLETTGAPMEIYITDPGTEPDKSKWVTEVYYLIKN